MWPDWFRNLVKRHTSLQSRETVYRACWTAFRATVRITFYTLGLPTLYLLEPIVRLRLGELRTDHIGHLAIEPELLLRQLRLDGLDHATRVFVVGHKAPANGQLLEMWRRRIRIVALRNQVASRAFSTVKPILVRTRFYQPLPGAFAGWQGGERCHEVMFRAGPQLAFTPAEDARGQAELSRMGVPDGAWFVAFHARDPAYYAVMSGRDVRRYPRTYRDMPVETMFEAMQGVAASGGYAIRMGSLVEQALPDLGPRVIDYATRHRTDFMDIYLSAKARFFMGSNSGLACVAQIFDVPVGLSNVFPYNIVPSGKGVTYLRMFLRDRTTGQILSVPEIKRRGLLQCPPSVAQEFDTQRYYDDRALEVIHNDAEDIKSLCMDMMDLVEGRPPAPEGVRLRDRNRMLYDGVDRSPDAGQIGARFAVRHALLIEPESAEVSHV